MVASYARPVARPEVAATPLDDELILFDPRSDQVYVFNTTGARIWSLCDGSRTTETLARELTVAYGLEHSQALADVGALLASLQDADLILME